MTLCRGAPKWKIGLRVLVEIVQALNMVLWAIDSVSVFGWSRIIGFDMAHELNFGGEAEMNRGMQQIRRNGLGHACKQLVRLLSGPTTKI